LDAVSTIASVSASGARCVAYYGPLKALDRDDPAGSEKSVPVGAGRSEIVRGLPPVLGKNYAKKWHSLGNFVEWFMFGS
jgi:hypothetical protein